MKWYFLFIVAFLPLNNGKSKRRRRLKRVVKKLLRTLIDELLR
ncbi:hypothetical protein [Lactobacillus johnsonii]